jgi:hypothetical protein
MPVDFANPTKIDPSRTALLRRRYAAELQRRFEELRQKQKRELAALLLLLLGRGVSADERLNHYTNGINTWASAILLGTDPKQPTHLPRVWWFTPFIAAAYQQGLRRAYEDAGQADFTPEQKATAATGFMAVALHRPARQAKLRLLTARTYENLKGIVGIMVAELARTAATDLSADDSQRQLQADLNKVIYRTVSRRVRPGAAAEIVGAQAEGQLDGYEDLGVTEVGAEVEWVTRAGPGASFAEMTKAHVCPKCQAMSGRRFTIKQARGLIPAHPFCFCSWMAL